MKNKKHAGFILGICLVLTLVGFSSVKAATLEVGPSGYPYTSIQAAINAATSGVDDVLVHDGTYLENINFLGKAITVSSENGPDFTTIDGNQNGSVVIFNSGESSSSILNGFTLTNGSGYYVAGYGTTGGGIYCASSSPTIINCDINYNTINSYGGGIYFSASFASIINCNINNNTTTKEGGGIYCDNSTPTVSDSVINNNLARNAGGFHITGNSLPVIEYCTINENTVQSYAGGILISSNASATITNCFIQNNSAIDIGGGICIWSPSSEPLTTITDCIISGNSVTGITSQGGGIAFLYGSGIVTNCTITENSSGRFGGGIFVYFGYSGPSPSVVNSIIWSNTAGFNGDQIYLDTSGNPPGSITVTYSDVQDGWPGLRNKNFDPEFVDPLNGNYHLSASSRCIDKGNNDVPYLPATDIDGDYRFIDGGGSPAAIVDMGADEFVPTP